MADAARRGNPAAARELGLLYLNGRGGVPVSPNIGLKYLALAAEDGDLAARAEYAWQFFEGHLHDPERLLPIDAEVALAWLGEQARKGDAEAAYRLALVHLQGLVARAEPAIPWLKKSAAAGNRFAQRRLATELIAGKNVGRDVDAANRWLKKAALAGDVGSQLMLGRLYAGDFGGSADAVQAARWFRRAASVRGRADRLARREAQARLGIAYRDGLGVASNAAEAESLLRKAALDGSGDAARALGRLYTEDDAADALSLLHRGEVLEHSWLGFCDLDKAAQYYQRAANLGNVEAVFRLGRLHYRQYEAMSEDPAVSWRRAEHLLTRAANAGIREAKYLLGEAYLYGADERGIRKDQRRAVQWLEAAASEGHTVAQFLLARAILGTDPRGALVWLRRAAASGDPHAAYWMGRCLEDGRGVVANKREARRWYREAAQDGLVTEAAVRLGNMYRLGHGGARDLEAAEAWLKWAADRGDEEAQKALVNCGGGREERSP